MFDLRDMELLVALERHRHFGRAANECGISQPAFSARIRNLELELGIAVVMRGNRFMGFTPEGEIVLKWARKMLQDADGLRQDLTVARGSLEGSLTLGVIPTALAFAAALPAEIRKMHENLKVEIISSSSTEIKRGIENFTFDAGISYIDDALPTTIEPTTLYQEEYLLLAPKHLITKNQTSITWKNAAKIPLCLLSKTMRNRRIIEEIFAQIGVEIEPIMETNALTVSLVQVENGTAATIVPRALVSSLPIGNDVIALELKDPTIKRDVGLLLAKRDPAPPAHAVLIDALNKIPR